MAATKTKSKIKSPAKKAGKLQSKVKAPTAVDFMSALYALGLLLAAYLAGTVAIDRGSLWFYGLMFVALYWSVHYAKVFVKQYFKK